MKSFRWILAIGLAASAWAQSLPPSALMGAQRAAGSAAQAASKPAAAALQPAGSSARAARPAAVPARAVESKARPQASGTPKGHGRKQLETRVEPRRLAAERKSGRKGQRDPFVSPIIERTPTGRVCTGTGRQCLFVGDISLQGVVRYVGGYVAVVVSGDHTYFLHQNDPLADGDVESITSDAILLRQRSSDPVGRPLVREVTKKLGAPGV